MGIMDIVRKWNESKKQKSEEFKEAQRQVTINKIIQERQKSSNERELERYMNEDRESNIKKQLEKVRYKKTHDLWTDNSILKKSNNILKNDKQILMQENIFLDNKTKIPLTSRGMFFN
jgi:predicted RND superfamily exporter protein